MASTPSADVRRPRTPRPFPALARWRVKGFGSPQAQERLARQSNAAAGEARADTADHLRLLRRFGMIDP